MAFSHFLYVLVIVNHERREIKHFAVTSHPTSAWVLQQLKEATPFGMQPEYLIHDNDSIFASKDLQEFLVNAKITSVRTGFHAPWQKWNLRENSRHIAPGITRSHDSI
jgi:hypothetical protein